MSWNFFSCNKPKCLTTIKIFCFYSVGKMHDRHLTAIKITSQNFYNSYIIMYKVSDNCQCLTTVTLSCTHWDLLYINTKRLVVENHFAKSTMMHWHLSKINAIQRYALKIRMFPTMKLPKEASVTLSLGIHGMRLLSNLTLVPKNEVSVNSLHAKFSSRNINIYF